MNIHEDFLWLLKIAFVLYCLWFIWGGPARIEQSIAQDKINATASIYHPKVYTQTIILR